MLIRRQTTGAADAGPCPERATKERCSKRLDGKRPVDASRRGQEARDNDRRGKTTVGRAEFLASHDLGTCGRGRARSSRPRRQRRRRAQKAAALFASFTAPPVPPVPKFDPEAAARQLAQGVHTLADDRDRLATRLSAIEREMRDSNGATKQQIEAAKAEAIKIAKQAPPWPESAPPVPMTLADVAVMVKTVSPAPSEAADAPAATPAVASTVEPGPPETTASVGQSYGVDLGTAATMKTLHQRWASLRAGHPQLFDGVQPMVSIKENPRTGRTELHLVIGPYANAETAAQFCDFVLPFRLNCQPTMFDGSRLAAQ
jgi:hypothetical protein